MNNNGRVGTWKNKVSNDFVGVSNTTIEDCPVYQENVKNSKAALQTNWSTLSSLANNILSTVTDEFTYTCVLSRQISSDFYLSDVPLWNERLTGDGTNWDSIGYSHLQEYNLYYENVINGFYVDALSATPITETGEWVVLNVVRNTTNTSLYINGNLCQTVSNGGNLEKIYNIQLGLFGGYMGDVMIHSRALENSELIQLNEYLDEKWGISSDPNPVIVFLPPPPTNFLIGTYTFEYVNMSWDAVSTADEYNIYRNGTLLTTVTSTSYQDTTVAAETNYTYYVTAVNSNGESRPSNIESIQTTINPTGVGNLLTWMDASDLDTLYDSNVGGSNVSIGGTVGRWEDKSGNGKHSTQSNAGFRPTLSAENGMYYLSFDGTDDFFENAINPFTELNPTTPTTRLAAITNQNQYGYFIVYTRKGNTSSPCLVGIDNSTGNRGKDLIIHSFSPTKNFLTVASQSQPPYIDVVGIVNGTVTDNSSTVVSFIDDTLNQRSVGGVNFYWGQSLGSSGFNTFNIWKNGKRAFCKKVDDNDGISFQSYTSGDTKLFFGKRLNGYIHEIVVYSSISPKNCLKIQNYLCKKWNISMADAMNEDISVYNWNTDNLAGSSFSWNSTNTGTYLPPLSTENTLWYNVNTKRDLAGINHPTKVTLLSHSNFSNSLTADFGYSHVNTIGKPTPNFQDYVGYLLCYKKDFNKDLSRAKFFGDKSISSSTSIETEYSNASNVYGAWGYKLFEYDDHLLVCSGMHKFYFTNMLVDDSNWHTLGIYFAADDVRILYDGSAWTPHTTVLSGNTGFSTSFRVFLGDPSDNRYGVSIFYTNIRLLDTAIPNAWEKMIEIESNMRSTYGTILSAGQGNLDI